MGKFMQHPIQMLRHNAPQLEWKKNAPQLPSRIHEDHCWPFDICQSAAPAKLKCECNSCICYHVHAPHSRPLFVSIHYRTHLFNASQDIPTTMKFHTQEAYCMSNDAPPMEWRGLALVKLGCKILEMRAMVE